MEPVACDLCGNVYDKAFTVILGGHTYTFDSFECAIQLVAPRCNHCGCTIIGHGVESDGRMTAAPTAPARAVLKK